MLLELSIQNVALIESIRIPFGPGLSVLTGETGAGKSIVVDSVSLAIGGRADRDLIRTGADGARVQAAFDISDRPEALSLLEQYGIPTGDGIATVSRELSAAGRNLCRICGSVVSLAQLRAFTALLMDMHGQHEHQTLLEPTAQLRFLDGCGGAEHEALLRETAKAHEAYADAERALKAASADAAERERLMDMLRFQLSEIDEAKPQKGELEKLEAKEKLYEHAERIAEKVRVAYAQTYAGSGRSLGAQEALKRALDAMADIAEYDERFEALRTRLEECYYTAQDIGLELQDLEEGLDADPDRLAKIEDRLDTLKRLLRKYGPEMTDVIAFRDSARERLDSLENADERRAELQNALQKTDVRFTEVCARLTNSRKALAESFCASVRRELADLGMPKLRFEARFQQKTGSRRTANGTDDVELYISPNPGEPVKPMASIASGGELARIMLAFKTVQNERDGVNTMIFDEIDTGVSGRMAQALGEKLARISSGRQVICVTHLPQIAALGDSQYLVEKREESGRTSTSVRLLDEEGRAAEISRLVGGADGSESALPHARNMLAQAQMRKEDLLGG